MPLVALAATTAVASGEMQGLSQAVDGIQKQFHISNATVSILPFAFAVVGVFGAPPFGMLADRVRRTRLITIAMVGWTLCMGLNGLAPTFVLLFAFRMGLGIVEANGPAALSLMSDYYPVQERAKRFGLYSSGALVGAMIGFVGGGLAVTWGGWRWAFLMWVPLGLVALALVSRLPEPERGAQDVDYHAALTEGLADEIAEELAAAEQAAEAAAHGAVGDGPRAAELVAKSGRLPPPKRVGTLDYANCSYRDVGREMLRIPSLWFGILAITISSMLLNGLAFWGVPYFKRVHHLNAAAAGGVTALFALGSAFGILGGGFISDRYLKRGVVNARVWVMALSSIMATFILVPAFASTNLAITGPLLLLGGFLLTLPVAPADAMVADVIVAPLRGRAYSIRAVVRALSGLGPVIIGFLSSALIHSGYSSADGLRWAIVALTPIYAVGGVLMLLCTRTYPYDVSFALAESERARGPA
jgi:MFS family permease